MKLWMRKRGIWKEGKDSICCTGIWEEERNLQIKWVVYYRVSRLWFLLLYYLIDSCGTQFGNEQGETKDSSWAPWAVSIGKNFFLFFSWNVNVTLKISIF